jgi:hypothetical protein
LSLVTCWLLHSANDLNDNEQSSTGPAIKAILTHLAYLISNAKQSVTDVGLLGTLVSGIYIILRTYFRPISIYKFTRVFTINTAIIYHFVFIYGDDN